MIGPKTAVDFKDQIDELLDTLRPLASTVRIMQSQFKLQVEISCVAYIRNVVPALYFTPEQLHVIQELGATIDVDFMLVGE